MTLTLEIISMEHRGFGKEPSITIRPFTGPEPISPPHQNTVTRSIDFLDPQADPPVLCLRDHVGDIYWGQPFIERSQVVTPDHPFHVRDGGLREIITGRTREFIVVATER